MAGLVPSNREGLRIYPPVWETGPPCRSFQPYVIGVSQKLSNASTNIFIFIPCFWHAGIKTQHLIPAVFSQLAMSNQTLAPRNRNCPLSATTANEGSDVTTTGSPYPHFSAHTHNVSGYATRTTAELRVIDTRNRSPGTAANTVSHPSSQCLGKRSLPRRNLVLIMHPPPPGSALEWGASPLFVEAQPQSFAAAALQPSMLSTLAW